MQPVRKAILAALLNGAPVFALSGCISVQAIEPVIAPPMAYRSDRAIAVEFAVPNTVGLRCAERGATFLGLPALNAGACSNQALITIVDPCMTVTAGRYAVALCQIINRKRSLKPALSKEPPAASPTRIAFQPTAQPGKAPNLDQVLVSFESDSALASTCAQPDAFKLTVDGELLGCWASDEVVMANPCGVEYSGWYTRTLCHELAHANGWPSNHPDHAPLANIRLASESPDAMAMRGK